MKDSSTVGMTSHMDVSTRDRDEQDEADTVHVKPRCVTCETRNTKQEITSWENLFQGSLTDYLRKHRVDRFDGNFSSSKTKCNSLIYNTEGPLNFQKAWNNPSITISCGENSSTMNRKEPMSYHTDGQKKAEAVFRRRKLSNRQSSSDSFILMDIIEELDEPRSRAGSAGSRSSFRDDGDKPGRISIEITGNSIGPLGTGIHSLGQNIPRRLSLEIIASPRLNRSSRASIVEDLTEKEHEMVMLSCGRQITNKQIVTLLP